jgi:TetR/AcrR family transcriptional regulator, regulator of cefoperazone and chloramphenicol sensitivity
MFLGRGYTSDSQFSEGSERKLLKRKAEKNRSGALDTRNKLLQAAIEAFAHKGYEGVGTRELAERAGVNLGAIRYYFGDKEGLYRAVIQHISEGIRERVSPFIEQVRSRVEKPDISRKELINSLCELITAFTFQLLGSGVPDNWARLVIREQVSPTSAFPTMYGVFRLLIDAGALIVAKIIGAAPESEAVRISVMTIVGQALVFRTHHATAVKFIGWKTIGPREISALQSVVSRHCRVIMTGRFES